MICIHPAACLAERCTHENNPTNKYCCTIMNLTVREMWVEEGGKGKHEGRKRRETWEAPSTGQGKHLTFKSSFGVLWVSNSSSRTWLNRGQAAPRFYTQSWIPAPPGASWARTVGTMGLGVSLAAVQEGGLSTARGTERWAVIHPNCHQLQSHSSVSHGPGAAQPLWGIPTMGTVPCLSFSTKCNIPNTTQLVAELPWRSPATDLSPEMLLCTKKLN